MLERALENSSGIFQVEEDEPMKEKKNGLKARRDTGGLGSVVDKQRFLRKKELLCQVVLRG